jgi:hypothetical protein
MWVCNKFRCADEVQTPLDVMVPEFLVYLVEDLGGKEGVGTQQGKVPEERVTNTIQQNC